MTKSINKQYKFVYLRDDRYDRSFDGNDFSDIRAKYPKFVIGNKKPEAFVYNKGVRADEFMSIYLSDYSADKQKSLTEAEWTTAVLSFCKNQLTEIRRDIRLCERNSDTLSYFRQVRNMLLPIYQNEIKVWKQKHKQLTDAGVYTYLELTK